MTIAVVMFTTRALGPGVSRVSDAWRSSARAAYKHFEEEQLARKRENNHTDGIHTYTHLIRYL